MEFGTILSLPDPIGEIDCNSGGCLQPRVSYIIESVADPDLRQELEDGQVGQSVRFDLTLGGTAATRVVKGHGDAVEAAESLAVEPGS